MHTTATERIAIAIGAFCLGIACCALFAPRATSAAPDTESWGIRLGSRQPVGIQFQDQMSPTESPWFATTIVGYDGALVACQDEGAGGTIFRPLANIRQIQVGPPGAKGGSGGSTGRGGSQSQ